MPRHKHIRGRDAAGVADELAHREPVKLLSSAGEKGKQVVGLSPQPVETARKAPPRVRRASSRQDQLLVPTEGLEAYKADLRKVFGETLSDEFVDAMLTKLITALRPGPYDRLDDATLNAAIAVIASVQPRNELEALMAVQIAATGFASLKLLTHSQHHLNELFVGVYGGYATRLLRLQLDLIQALDKHRRGNKQTVRVEHVHFHSGAQGVVGFINSEKKGDQG